MVNEVFLDARVPEHRSVCEDAAAQEFIGPLNQASLVSNRGGQKFGLGVALHIVTPTPHFWFTVTPYTARASEDVW